MKLTKYIPLLALGAIMATSCSEEPELPPMMLPQATIKANTTILDLKQTYWQTDRNYVATIGTTEDGEHIVIKGRVQSSDASGNIYKSVIIADETAALTVAINQYDIYQTYQFGQEVLIDVTDMKIGGYNGLMQLGGEGTYNGAPSMTFMEESTMADHAQQNGLANPELVEATVVTIPQLDSIKASTQGLIEWQSRLIKIEGLAFETPGTAFAAGSNANDYMLDSEGNKVNLRCSSYANFANDLIPSGTGSVTAILSYYGTDWQLLLNDVEGLEGFEEFEPAAPAEDLVFAPTTEIIDGALYAFYADSKVSVNFEAAKNYGYMPVEDCTLADDATLQLESDQAYVITSTADGYYTIQGADGRYIYMTESYNSVNLSATLDTDDEGYLWEITFNSDGSADVTNVAKQKTMQYYAAQPSYGWYSDERGTKPTIYKH